MIFTDYFGLSLHRETDRRSVSIVLRWIIREGTQVPSSI